MNHQSNNNPVPCGVCGRLGSFFFVSRRLHRSGSFARSFVRQHVGVESGQWSRAVLVSFKIQTLCLVQAVRKVAEPTTGLDTFPFEGAVESRIRWSAYLE